MIGASRITYAMSSHQQLPEVFRRLHPKLKTPWLALIVFGAIGPTIFLLSGQVDFLGRMYAFGAMLSFTIAHASIVALRIKQKDSTEGWRARPNLRFRGINWPLFAIVGGLGTGIAWLVVVDQDPATRYAGFAWLAVGFVFYVLYRRHSDLPLTTTMRAPMPLGAALALEYRSILVPIVAGPESREAVELAARLATERAGRIVLLRVIVVPLELPLDADLREQLEEADELLDEARAVAAPYGVRVVERVVRARNAGAAIVEEAERRGAEIIVLGSRRGERPPGDLRRHGRLRAQARPVPRDGRGGPEGGSMSVARQLIRSGGAGFAGAGAGMLSVGSTELIRSGGAGFAGAGGGYDDVQECGGGDGGLMIVLGFAHRADARPGLRGRRAARRALRRRRRRPL